MNEPTRLMLLAVDDAHARIRVGYCSGTLFDRDTPSRTARIVASSGCPRGSSVAARPAADRRGGPGLRFLIQCGLPPRTVLCQPASAATRAFPPRLPTQPIFYPVLYEEYAVQIARDWNATDAATGYRGCVTRFRVREGFLQNYEVHTVGSSRHRE